jgi:hypothetical protein
MRPLTARAVAMTAGLHRELLDFETAEALSEQARETARSAAFVPPVVSAGIDLLLNAARRQDPGRADALLGEVEGAVSRAGGWHGWLWRLRLTQARAELALARGRLVNAVELATSAMDQSRDRRRLKYLACGLVTRAEARAALDQIRDAHDDLTAALDVARRIDDPALVLRVLAAFLRIDGTDALAAEAHVTVARITLALPDSLLRRRFEDAEVVRRLGRQ